MVRSGTDRPAWVAAEGLAPTIRSRNPKDVRVIIRWTATTAIRPQISPLEIENALMKHPDVANVSIVGAPDAERGEMVVAFVVPAPGARFDMAAMTAHLTACGFARQKFPERLELVETLPMNAVGKVQKPELRKIAAGLVAGASQ